MGIFARLAARLRNLLRRRRIDAELGEELQFHLDRAIDANRANGLSAIEARRAAMRDLGGLEQVRQAVRDVRWGWIESTWRDVVHGGRRLAAAPTFAAALVVTLALGIGANTAMFSVLYGLLIRPLPYRDAARLALIRREAVVTGAHRQIPVPFNALPDIQAWQERLHAFDSTALYSNEVVALQSAEGSEVLESAVVSDTFFSLLGGALSAGRPLGPTDDLTNAVVISESLALRLFGAPSTAVGRTLSLSARPYTVVGVTAAPFQFPTAETGVWMPAGFARSLNPGCCGFHMIGRLAPRQTIAAASAEAQALAASLETLTPGRLAGMHAAAVGLHEQMVAPVRPALLVLFVATALVLIAACANAGNLLVSRQISRARERAIRLALGASRGRLVRETILECLVLAAVATALGLMFARAIVSLPPQTLVAGVPRLDAVQLDGIVLLFSVALAGAVTLGTAMMPLVRNESPADALRSGPASSTSRGSRRLSRLLCVVQLTSSLILLVGAALLGRSYLQLVRTDLGVEPDHVVTMVLNLGFGRRPTDAETRGRVERVLERVMSLSQVRAAGVGTALPPKASNVRVTLRRKADAVDYQASMVAATPGYFDALGMRLVRGRLFSPADDANHEPVMIMTVDTARRFFGDGDPIGRTLKLPGIRDGKNKTGEAMTLVGVVANVKYSGLEALADDAVYRPFAQQSWIATFLVVRTADDPARFVPAVRQAVAAADRDMVIAQAGTLDDVLSRETAPSRFRTALLATMAGLVLLMASVGLYGVMAQAVALRTREIGIRMALGARPPDLLAMVVREGGRLAFAGIAVGLVVAFALTRAMGTLLYGIAPTDPASFAIAAIVLAAVAIGASYLPARRAAKVDPLVVLRGE